MADKYAEVKRLKQSWRKNKSIGEVNFAKYKDGILPRLEDSLMQVLIKKHFILNELVVSKPDKKSTFIEVVVSTRDEKLSALLSQRLVQIASDEYVQSKIKVKLQNVRILQKRSDSLAAILNYKTFYAAESQQSFKNCTNFC